MHTYCVLLGHQPHISLAELYTVIPDLKPIRLWTPKVLLFQTEAVLDQKWLQNVGGTILVAEQVSTEGRTVHDLEKIVPGILYEKLKHVKRKATFSFRCLDIPHSQIRTLYKSAKHHLKDRGLHPRYIGNERNPAKPGTLLLRGIPGEQSCELVILYDAQKKQIWIGMTCAVQDIRTYTERDMDKPFRDTRTGLLPPKLAQVLMNFGLSLIGTPPAEGITVWDPFCGSGVIALEALSRRMSVLASDTMKRAVDGCEMNIRWLRERHKTPKSVTHTVLKHDATKPQEFQHVPSIIVTETSLGPALQSAPTKRDIQSMVREAEHLEVAFLRNVRTLLPTTPVVCTFPVYVTREGERFFLPTALNAVLSLGYRLVIPSGAHIQFTDRNTLLYIRPDQFVGREIICLLPTKNAPAPTPEKKKIPVPVHHESAPKKPSKHSVATERIPDRRPSDRRKKSAHVRPGVKPPARKPSRFHPPRKTMNAQRGNAQRRKKR